MTSIEGEWDNDDYYEETVHESEEFGRASFVVAGGQKATKPGVKEFKPRPYVARHKPNDRFMMTVTKGDEAEKIGLQLVQYENELYVSRIDKGPFYASAIDYGDKILSINGKKPATDIKSVEEAEQVMCTKPKITLFVMRPDPKRDKGYRWVMENT